jgi:hypothetical protein
MMCASDDIQICSRDALESRHVFEELSHRSLVDVVAIEVSVAVPPHCDAMPEATLAMEDFSI